MKKRMIKLVIPALAIIFAIATSAFTAMDNSTVDDNMLITGYYQTGNPLDPCEDEQVDCSVQGRFDCTISGVDYFQLNGTSCDIILKRNVQ